MAGVFVTKGMTLGFPAGSLTLHAADDGKITGNAVLHVHFDVCPTWFELALQHLEAARLAQIARTEAWRGEDNDHKAVTLEKEFEASMQCIVAAATAIDAFYAVIQSKAAISEDLIATWRNKKTARYRQIAEVMRVAFTLSPKGLTVLRDNIKEIYRYRDAAVHPHGRVQAALLHPELEVGTEWRFVWFRYENAALLLRESLSLIHQLVSRGKPQNEAIQKYAEALRPRTAGMLGRLTDQPPS